MLYQPTERQLVARVTTLREFLGVDAPSIVESQPLAVDNPTIIEFCQGIVFSQEYRQSLRDRIVLGTLPPQIEALFYYYAFGKPSEKLEVRSTSVNLEDITPEQVEDRIAHLHKIAQHLRSVENGGNPEAGNDQLGAVH